MFVLRGVGGSRYPWDVMTKIRDLDRFQSSRRRPQGPFWLKPMTARFSVLKNVLSGRFNARDDFWVVQVAKKPSQLVFVPSMAISQQYMMPSFWFLGRGGSAQKLLLLLGSLLEMVLAGWRRALESWDRRIG